MVAAKVLRVIGVADPVALGNEGYALVAMRMSAGADPRLVSERFEACDEVTFVLFAAGRFDLVVEVICETHRTLRDFLLEHCYGQADIASVEPMLALALYKNLMKWGRP
jgi:Lrp/AsnC family transcriptional regulator for asnA, asnC and gidA